MSRIKTQIKDKELVQKRREQVSQAAIRLFLEKGYHATTMREICRESGVNRGSIYDYFPNKADILISIYEEMMRRRLWGKGSPFRDPRSLQKPFREFFKSVLRESWTRNRDGILILYRESDALERKTLKRVLSIEAQYIRYLTAELKRRTGWRGSPGRLEILANLLVFVNAFFPLRGWNLKKYDLELLLEVVADLFLRGLAKRCALPGNT
jgi:AcrR family transcriptional regulator